MVKRWNVLVLGVLGVHLLSGIATVTAQEADPGSAAQHSGDVRRLPMGGPLEAGTYASSAVGPEMTFSVDDGWAVVRSPGPGFVIGHRSGGHALGFTPFGGTVMAEPCFAPERSMDPHEVSGAETAWLVDPANQTTVDASVEGFWSHLAANPYLTVGEPAEVEIGGFSGIQASVSASVADDCSPRHTVLWYVPTREAWILRDGAMARYTALDVAGTVVIVAAESAPGLSDHEARLEADDAVLETLTITPDTLAGED